MFIFENILKFTKFISQNTLDFPPKFLYKILIVPIIGVIKNKRRKVMIPMMNEYKNLIINFVKEHQKGLKIALLVFLCRRNDI